MVMPGGAGLASQRARQTPTTAACRRLPPPAAAALTQSQERPSLSVKISAAPWDAHSWL